NTFNTKYKKTVNYLNIRDYEHKIEEVNYQQIEDKIDLYDAIDRLDEKYKTPIILQYFQDMTIGEIAEILDINENTIKTYLRRGKASLYELLKEEK
ncbi:TPA: sigma-70 family RNA polymerase sigma factor, partial [Clostridioides difficile]|nr:sigma-70 family RNA polymerase sigma factor [Clostridioides difficile]